MLMRVGFIAGALSLLTLPVTAQASEVPDTALASPGVYYGSGNSGLNTGWATNTDGGVELGLSTNYRYIGQVAPDSGTGTYHVNTGFYTGPGGTCIGVCSLWNIEFSVNTSGSSLTLGGVSTSLSITDVGKGGSVSFDPFNDLPDNSAYDGTNTRDGNTSAPATTTDVGFQNSENLAYLLPGFDPTADDTYLVTLSLTDPAGLNFSVDETIIAGAGAATTPLPATLPLFGTGLGALALFASGRKRKKVVTV